MLHTSYSSCGWKLQLLGQISKKTINFWTSWLWRLFFYSSRTMFMYRRGPAALFRNVLPGTQVYIHCTVPLGFPYHSLRWSLLSIRSIAWEMDFRLCSLRVSGWSIPPQKQGTSRGDGELNPPTLHTICSFPRLRSAFVEVVSDPPVIREPAYHPSYPRLIQPAYALLPLLWRGVTYDSLGLP